MISGVIEKIVEEMVAESKASQAEEDSKRIKLQLD